MIKLKNILLEKKELGPNFIKNIKSLTNRNNHTEARIELAKAVGDKRLVLFYTSMLNLNQVFQGYPGELVKLNNKMEKVLYKQLLRTYSNYDEIYNAL